MSEVVGDTDAQRRDERRLNTRALDIYARSSIGGFLYLVAWCPLLIVTEMPRRSPWLTLATTLAFLFAAMLRKRTRPPERSSAQRAWINRYCAIALSSTLIWSLIQLKVLTDPEITPLIKSASLFGTIAFSTVLAHLYTTVMRLSISGIALLVLPSLLVLWLDPTLHVLAITLTLYSGYLVTAMLRSRVDYERRLELDEALRDQRDRYQRLSRVDALTGLCNRRTFSETLNAQVREAQWLSGADVVLALLDIDHFKDINDRYGHVIGDEVLRKLAVRLDAAFSGSDFFVSRTGGEEFGLILRDFDEIGAMVLVEAFREALEAEPIECAGIKVPVTVSIGIGRFDRNRHRDDDGLYGAVDIALYAAKQQGRNRVVPVSMLEPDAEPVTDVGLERLSWKRSRMRSQDDA